VIVHLGRQVAAIDEKSVVRSSVGAGPRVTGPRRYLRVLGKSSEPGLVAEGPSVVGQRQPQCLDPGFTVWSWPSLVHQKSFLAL
jgi:hypothetical protein